MSIVTVDPGLTGTGWAVWDKNWELIDHGVIKAKSNLTPQQDRKQILSSRLHTQIAIFSPEIMYIEYPAKFSSVKGDMVAGRGDLVKLAQLVGYFHAYFNAKGLRTLDVTVNEWKGQMPKEAVMRRIKRLLPKVRPHSHDYDAIGLGLYLKGVF